MELHQTKIHTSDVDAFAAWDQNNGWTSKKTQLSKGKAWFRTDIAILGELTVWRHWSTARMLSEFTPPEDVVEFMFARCPSLGMWNGIEVTSTPLVLHHDTHTYRTIAPGRTIAYGFIFPKRLVRELGLVPGDSFLKKLPAEHALFPVVENVAASFFHFIDSIVINQHHVGHDRMEVAYTYESTVSRLQGVLDACLKDQSESSDSRIMPNRKLVDNARDIMESRLQEPINIAEIAKEVGASRRSLESAFKAHIGTSPYQFLNLQRLHATHRMLKQGEYPINHICRKFGFNNPGRFAKMYAELFGELPSETLKPTRLR